MALGFFENGARKRLDQIMAVDLGSRTTKAVHLQRRGETYALCRFALLDAPIFEKTMSVEMLTEHLKSVNHALQAKTKLVSLTAGANDAILRHVEMPRMPVEDMRLILKNNSRSYLQQDLINYVFDCHVIPGGGDVRNEASKGAAAQAKQKVLVAGAKRQLVDDFTNGARAAGLVAEQIVPGLIGPVNAFEKAMPEVFAKDVIALVDVGFKCTSICILQEGELILSRVVSLGGDRLTNVVSETMNITYAEAEGIKIGMAHEVQSALESVLLPLGRELRASIDFFEHQQDRTVSQAFITGGSARSELVLQTLQHELMVECKTWNPVSSLQMSLTSDQAAEVEQVSSQLAVAVGAALAAL
jgi:type IV pilus assembly protein PilM